MSDSHRRRFTFLAASSVGLALLACTAVGGYLGVGRHWLDQPSWLTLLRGHAWLSGADCQVGSSDYGIVTLPAIALWQTPTDDAATLVGSLAHGSAVRVLERRYLPEREAQLYLVAHDDVTGWVAEQYLRNAQPGPDSCR